MQVKLWDIFFIGGKKALVCIPPQERRGDKPVRQALMSMRGNNLLMRLDDGGRLSIILPDSTAQKFKECQEFLIAEGQGMAGFTASYEALWK